MHEPAAPGDPGARTGGPPPALAPGAPDSGARSGPFHGRGVAAGVAGPAGLASLAGARGPGGVAVRLPGRAAGTAGTSGPRARRGAAELGAWAAARARAREAVRRIHRGRRTVEIGHRGAAGYAPENTLAGIRAARARGADLVELDVQQTRDGRLVLLHDRSLARTTDVERVFPGRAPWRVRDFTLAEIRRLDAGSWFSPRYRGERVPTLGEAMAALAGGGTGIMLEIKRPRWHPGIVRRVAATVAHWHPRPLIVQSFSMRALREFRRLRPDVPAGISGSPAPGRFRALARELEYVGVRRHEVTPSYVRRAHRAGLRVMLAYTARTPDQARRVARLRLDALITNLPGRVRIR
ncbi:glycerophosphodiester phosphodiesterase [Bailinhaonella thermotolerans]|uniref:Glycerophosphodiester phosphodiesterase n=2 Tax=Bailinhaonella thermotolerans TaxID=1070861 RepID=A0A3A4A944_9ACTN|nr:glycerophosphodiester phosphodiesterase [Bailinhaonella thermotolerans]